MTSQTVFRFAYSKSLFSYMPWPVCCSQSSCLLEGQIAPLCGTTPWQVLLCKHDNLYGLCAVIWYFTGKDLLAHAHPTMFFSRDSMLSGSALALLELSEASSPESSSSSPSLETVVNLVPEAKATSTTIALRSAYRVMWKLRMSNTHGAKK